MKKAIVLFAVTVFVLCLSGMAGAYTITNNTTGGDCIQMGLWDAATRTCTLKQDLSVEDSTDTCALPIYSDTYDTYVPCGISVAGNGITIDGNGHTITGPVLNGGRTGIALNGFSDITVKNLTVTGTWIGIFAGFSSNTKVVGCDFESNTHHLLLNSSQYATVIDSSFTGSIHAILTRWGNGDHTFERNMFTDNNYGIRLDMSPPNVIINENTFSSNNDAIVSDGDNIQITNNLIKDGYFGLRLSAPAQDAVISNNEVLSNKYGVLLSGVDTALLSGNTVSGGIYGIMVENDDDYVAKDITLTGNTLSDNSIGLHIGETSDHLIYHNNFIGNYNDLSPWTTVNIWSLDLPDGGNYWDKHDSSSEGCTDNDGNGICDQPYSFYFGTDYFPWTKPGGWLCQSAPGFALASFTPESIWPPNHKGVNITVTGQIVLPEGCTLTDASFSFTDEYGEYSASGALDVAADGSFTLTLPAAADRDSSDRDGRTYSLVLSATDDVGTAQSEPLVSTVLHDMRK